MSETKVCTKCGAEKPTSEFHRDRSRRDGLSNRCKTCRIAESSEWCKAHPDKAIAYQAAYHASHKDEARVYQAAYREQHKDERAEHGRKYYAEHKEELRAKQFAYRKTHHDQCRARERQYNETHREKRRDYKAVYQMTHRDELRARKAAYYLDHRQEISEHFAAVYYPKHKAEIKARVVAWSHTDKGRMAKVAYSQSRRASLSGIRMTRRTVAELRSESGGICPYCNKPITEGHIDHIVPVSRGGTNARGNLAWVCAPCNQSKNSYSLLEFMIRRVTA